MLIVERGRVVGSKRTWMCIVFHVSWGTTIIRLLNDVRSNDVSIRSTKVLSAKHTFSDRVLAHVGGHT